MYVVPVFLASPIAFSNHHDSLYIIHWLLCTIYRLLGGGGRKISTQEQRQFDIVKELSNMKPLRKVSRQQLDIGIHQLYNLYIM